MKITRLIKIIAADYLICSGLCLNVLLIGLYVYDVTLIHLVYERAEKVLRSGLSRNPPINKQGQLKEQLANDIAGNFGEWRPLPHFEPVAAGQVSVDDILSSSLSDAMANLHDGQLLVIGSGTYREPLVVTANNVTIIGSGRVVFDGATAEGKAAIVTKGKQITISNIECKNIAVDDLNGACIRSEGGSLTVDHVYFHDSEQGILASNNQYLHISNSRFEKLGKYGRAHGVYVGEGGELLVENSLFLASVSEGHEIKSRASKTIIKNSVLASLNADDSRLIDVPNGGELLVVDSVLEKGPQSVNATAIGYGLEGIKYGLNSITLKKNVIILERDGQNALLDKPAKEPIPLRVVGNIIVSKDEVDVQGLNWPYLSRQEAKLEAYPKLPVLEAKQP
ncbi:MAG: right-handed parallel beta-helix repeat-containing protein [Methylovulum miyakonense]|uniref:right-handed parallel beta-helix repeat-containing protein n=1 Tax=Methylovulum miyakonense TaxID=645578 RepID=UPI003BB63396